MAQKENFGQKTKSSIEIAEEKTLNLKKGNDLSSQMLTKQSYKPSIHFRTSTINKKYVEKKENSIMIDEKSKIQKMQSKPETESNEKNNAVPKENLLRNQNQNLVVKSQEEHIKVGPKPDILDGSKKKDELKEQSVKEAQKVGLSQEGNFFENNYSNEFKNKATKSNTRIKEAQPELFSVSNPKIDTLKPFEEFEHSIKNPPENHKELETTEISNLEKAQINPQKIDSEGKVEKINNLSDDLEVIKYQNDNLDVTQIKNILQKNLGNKLKSSSKTESGGKVFSSEEIDLVNSKIPNTGELSSSRIDHKKQLSKKKKVKGNEKLKVNTLYNPNEKTKPSKVTLKDFFQALDQHISAPGNSVRQETKKTLISGDLIQVDNSINENKNLLNNVEVKSDLSKKEEMLEYRNLHSYSEVKPEQSNSLSFKDHMEENIIKQKDDNNSSKIHTSLLRNLPESSTLSYVNNNALSVDPLAVAHSKNLETPFKSEAEAVSIRTLKEYFQNSDNPKRIALKTWESWKTKKLDPEMMYHLAVDLNLKESQMAYVPLDLINDIRIKKLLEYIAKNLEDYKRAEEWFIESMIPHEGNRRIIALRNQIKQYTVINKWKTLSSKLLKKFPKHKDYINSLDHQYGITLGEPSVLANKDFSPLKDPEGFDSFVIIERVFGYEEAKNRWELLEFVKKRSAQIKWCFEDPKYNLADLRYGVSFIRALKAADSLQFGRQLWFGFDWGRISIEDRFYTLLEAMSPLNNYMLWNESAERIWILNFNNKNYEKKLGDFCLLVTKNQKILKEQISNSATKMKDFEDKTGVSINDPALDSLGDIFICFEIGLYIPEILNMKRKLASVIEIIENVETVEDMETCKDLIDLFSDSKSKMLISIIFAWFPKALNNDEIGGLIGFKHSMMTEEEKFFFLRQVKLSRLYFNEEIPVWCQQLSVFFNSDHGSARKIKH
ncbi:expressed protein [Phakopsora pachyrhizi]|uniref:Expressed protein n=1 Tax=Phakopsora pachyrhizi TaxID=170000 RepID=A0AAV0B532_PHAPC|nr:expressed protein [Phakopsora pachyrhizi]